MWWTSCSRIPWTKLMANKVILALLGGQRAVQPPCPKPWMGAEPSELCQGLCSPHPSPGTRQVHCPRACQGGTGWGPGTGGCSGARPGASADFAALQS